MSRSGAVDEAWGDGTYRFRLGYAQLEELEEKCGAGTFEIYGRLSPKSNAFGQIQDAPAWRIKDLFHTIRLGLIGGGMASSEALKLVLRYFDEWPKIECGVLCEKILGECLSGHPEERVGKEAADEASPASTSPASIKPAAQRARRRSKSAE